MKHAPSTRPRFFFTTAPSLCPYLPNRVERKVVTELGSADPAGLHDRLSQAGFRRSHAIAYAPACPDCNACVAVRIPVAELVATRTFRRLWKANEDLRASQRPARATTEQYRLFSEYQASRHADGDMAAMSFEDYRAMVEDSPIRTALFEFRRRDGSLAAVCLTDILRDGLSAVYSFFEDGPGRRSLGTYMILWLCEKAREMDLAYVYLGYWIDGCRKMDYKARFRPLEGFTTEGWTRIRVA